MLVVKLIKKLKALTAKLKASAIKRSAFKLAKAAVSIDEAQELAEKRMLVAEQIKEALELRACTKLGNDIDKANDKKVVAGKEIDELLAV